jgi:hypothetical protein
MLVRNGRRQQQPRLDCNAHAFLVLEHPFLQDALEGQARVGDLELGTGLESKLSDRFPVLREAVVEHDARRGNRVLSARPFEGEIAELDLDFPPIADGRIRGDKRAIGERGCRHEQNREQRQEDLD